MEEKCAKCGYESEENLEKFNNSLCHICHYYSPNNEREFQHYIKEKVDPRALDSFRRYGKVHGQLQKKGMIAKASQGKVMSRAAFGYKIQNGLLIPAENYKEIEEIFEEFLTQNISLRQLSSKHNLSVNGLKKILSNFTYIGKIKFDGQIIQGNHQPILSPILFNHVQNKLLRLEQKRDKNSYLPE